MINKMPRLIPCRQSTSSLNTHDIVILQNVFPNRRPIHPRNEILESARHQKCRIFDHFGANANVALIDQFGGVLDVLGHFICNCEIVQNSLFNSGTRNAEPLLTSNHHHRQSPTAETAGRDFDGIVQIPFGRYESQHVEFLQQSGARFGAERIGRIDRRDLVGQVTDVAGEFVVSAE